MSAAADEAWKDNLSQRMREIFGDYNTVIDTCNDYDITIDKIYPGAPKLSPKHNTHSNRSQPVVQKPSKQQCPTNSASACSSDLLDWPLFTSSTDRRPSIGSGSVVNGDNKTDTKLSNSSTTRDFSSKASCSTVAAAAVTGVSSSTASARCSVVSDDACNSRDPDPVSGSISAWVSGSALKSKVNRSVDSVDANNRKRHSSGAAKDQAITPSVQKCLDFFRRAVYLIGGDGPALAPLRADGGAGVGSTLADGCGDSDDATIPCVSPRSDLPYSPLDLQREADEIRRAKATTAAETGSAVDNKLQIFQSLFGDEELPASPPPPLPPQQPQQQRQTPSLESIRKNKQAVERRLSVESESGYGSFTQYETFPYSSGQTGGSSPWDSFNADFLQPKSPLPQPPPPPPLPQQLKRRESSSSCRSTAPTPVAAGELSPRRRQSPRRSRRPSSSRRDSNGREPRANSRESGRRHSREYRRNSREHSRADSPLRNSRRGNYSPRESRRSDSPPLRESRRRDFSPGESRRSDSPPLRESRRRDYSPRESRRSDSPPLRESRRKDYSPKESRRSDSPTPRESHQRESRESVRGNSPQRRHQRNSHHHDRASSARHMEESSQPPAKRVRLSQPPLHPSGLLLGLPVKLLDQYRPLGTSRHLAHQRQRDYATQTEEAPPPSRPTAAVPPVQMATDNSFVASSNSSSVALTASSSLAGLPSASSNLASSLETQWLAESFESLFRRARDLKQRVDAAIRRRPPKEDPSLVGAADPDAGAKRHFLLASVLFLAGCWAAEERRSSAGDNGQNNGTRRTYFEISQFIRHFIRVFHERSGVGVNGGSPASGVGASSSTSSGGGSSGPSTAVGASTASGCLAELCFLMLKSVVEYRLYCCYRSEVAGFNAALKANRLADAQKTQCIERLMHIYHADETWRLMTRLRQKMRVEMPELKTLEDEVVRRCGVTPSGPGDRIGHLLSYLHTAADVAFPDA